MIKVSKTCLRLPHTYYPAIGEFLFRFGQLEQQLREIIWMSLDIGNKRGRILTVGADFRALCGQITTIASRDMFVAEKFLRQEMNYVAGAARKTATFRNSLVHGVWESFPNGDPQLLFMKEADDRYMPSRRSDIDDAYLHREAGKLRALNDRAEKLRDKLELARPSLQKKS